jgi:small-conductance mechanosensitive channel
MDHILPNFKFLLDFNVLTIFICILGAIAIAHYSKHFLTNKLRLYFHHYHDISEAMLRNSLFFLLASGVSWLFLLFCAEWYDLSGIDNPILDDARQINMYFALIVLFYYLYSLHKKISFFTFLIFFIMLAVAIVSSLDISASLIKILKGYYIIFHGYKITLYLFLKEIFFICVAFWVVNTVILVVRSYFKSINKIESNTKELLNKALEVLLYSIAILTILNSLGVDLTSITVISGALGVGIAVGLQQITANFISGIILLAEKTIVVGDLIELPNGKLGTIKQLASRYTLIEGIDGREVMIPNADFITTKIVNLTFSDNKFCIAFNVVVDYKEDIDKVILLMIETIKKHPKCVSDHKVECYIENFLEYGVSICLNFWIENALDGIDQLKGTGMSLVLKAFKENNIKVATAIKYVKV